MSVSKHEFSKFKEDVAKSLEDLKQKMDEQLEMKVTAVKADCMKEVMRIQERCDNRITEITTKFEAKVDTLLDVLVTKDEAINKLNKHAGDFAKSLEVTDLAVKSNKEEIGKLSYTNGEIIKELNYSVDKSSDLEDRSMRQNLIFRGFDEEEGETSEDCEKKLRNLIMSKDMLNGKGLIQMDRTHRLGAKKREQRQSRAIICKMTYYKDKDMILKNARKLRGTKISMSEQFSQQTTETHSKLYKACKTARDMENSPINKFFINYKYASVWLKNGQKKNVNLHQIEQRSDWFLPTPKRGDDQRNF